MPCYLRLAALIVFTCGSTGLLGCKAGPSEAREDHEKAGHAAAEHDAVKRLESDWLFDETAFEPLAPARPGSWRARMPEERGQSLAEFEAGAPNRPSAERKVLVLQPLAPFPHKVVLAGDLPSVQLEEEGFVTFVFSPRPGELARFLAAFYGLEARAEPELPLPELPLAPARVRGHHAQYDARALLEAMGARLPADAYSMTVLVARDLVASEAQEFAFGYGLHRDRLAVASFAQLDPQFGGRQRAADFQSRIRTRAHKLVAHEVGHTLGMEHCDQHACVMNGVAHLAELDATPLHLCPLCLRKLASLTSLDGAARYEALARYYEGSGLERELGWVEQRLASRR